MIDEYKQYDDRIEILRIKIDQYEKMLDSENPPIDIENKIDIMKTEIEDLLIDINVEKFLISVEQILVDEGYLKE